MSEEQTINITCRPVNLNMSNLVSRYGVEGFKEHVYAKEKQFAVNGGHLVTTNEVKAVIQRFTHRNG